MDDWTTANGSAGASALWWAAARDVSVASDLWHTAYGDGTAFASGAFVETYIGSVNCDETTGTWTA